MATTKAKESTNLGKERRNNSAPNSLTISSTNTPTKRSIIPKSSPKAHSIDLKLSHSPSSSSPSTPSEKHLPNYLKSTASSRHDQTLKQLKKPAPIPENRPTLNRRRSFDKPLSTAPRLEKPFRSPGPRNRATHVPIRSSSFGSQPSSFVSSAKPGLLERSASKISKAAKPQQPVHNLRSSGNHTKKSLKKETTINSTTSSAKSAAKIKTVNVEQVDQCYLVPGDEEEDIKKIECELDQVDLPDPMPELDVETRTDRPEITVDVSSKEADRKEETPPPSETENETPKDEAKLLIPEEEDGEPNENENEESGDNKEAEKMGEKSENDHDKKEDEQDGQQPTEKDVEAVTTAGKQRQGGPGRKESAAVYNDVIEETASKLLEKRKNKVKALAGAFQTVIDYESSSK